jgi:hypothetical protein
VLGHHGGMDVGLDRISWQRPADHPHHLAHNYKRLRNYRGTSEPGGNKGQPLGTGSSAKAIISVIFGRSAHHGPLAHHSTRRHGSPAGGI